MPVVSTPIPDVIADYGDVVTVAGSPVAFAEACLAAAVQPPSPEHLMQEASRRAKTWDQIAAEMDELVGEAVANNLAAEGSLP
jgi:hypothetical protein